MEAMQRRLSGAGILYDPFGLAFQVSGLGFRNLIVQ